MPHSLAVYYDFGDTHVVCLLDPPLLSIVYRCDGACFNFCTYSSSTPLHESTKNGTFCEVERYTVWRAAPLTMWHRGIDSIYLFWVIKNFCYKVIDLWSHQNLLKYQGSWERNSFSSNIAATWLEVSRIRNKHKSLKLPFALCWKDCF